MTYLRDNNDYHGSPRKAVLGSWGQVSVGKAHPWHRTRITASPRLRAEPLVDGSSTIARQRENAEGVSVEAAAQTTAVALYCIDGLAGSTIGRQRHANLGPDGFAQVSNPAHGPALRDTNYHAETNALASITDFVRPRPGWPPAGSIGFVIIMSDRELCNFCNGYIRRWTRTYPGISVYTTDPVRPHIFIGGFQVL